MADTSATRNNLRALDENQDSPSTPLGRRLLRTLAIGGVFGGLFLYLSLRNVPFDRVTDALRLADWTLIVTSISCYFAYLVVKAWRWSVQLKLRTDSRPFGVLFRLVTIGTAANAMIPHSGEIVRSYAARGDLKLSATSILGSIAAERFYDFAMVLLLAGIAFAAHPSVPQQLSNAMVSLFALGSVCLCVLLVIARRKRNILAIINFMERFLPKRLAVILRHQAKELSAGIEGAVRGEIFVPVVILSVIQWLLITACIFLSIRAVGIDEGPLVALIVLPLTVIGLTLPTAPAYIGTLQACFLVALHPLGVEQATALAASFVYAGVVAVPTSLAAVVLAVYEFRIRARPSR